MAQLGVVLILVGLGSFLLPLIGYQFTLVSLFDEQQPWTGIVIIALGIALVAWALARQRSTAARS
ncbi:MAG TPA: hypothetical protein VGK63_04500 [Candidatus Limnocylindrales bacterium]